MSDFNKELSGFSKWVALSNVNKHSIPKGQQVVYVVRAVNEKGVPVSINRARKVDDLGILNIGSGNGPTRLHKLKKSIPINDVKDWKRATHHQLILWWFHFDFESVLGIKKTTESIEVFWQEQTDDKSAREKEKTLLWRYKRHFTDLPIGNLKSW